MQKNKATFRTTSFTQQSLTTVILIIVVAIVYFLFGIVCLEITLPFSKVSAIWPPAGIALASILLYGLRICPGIFIGSFCISAWSYSLDIHTIPLYICTAIGTTVFAMTGFFLIKKFSAFPNELIVDKEIILFLILGGPVSCLIPATLSISAMIFYNIISHSEILVNWLSWWVGDTIGVLIFTPLTLTILTQNSKLWKRRRLSLGLPLITSFAIILSFFFYILQLETSRHQTSFQENSLAVTHKLERQINNHIQFIHSVHDFYKSSEQVEKQELESFTHSFLYEYDENRAFSFLEYMPATGETKTKTTTAQYTLYKGDYSIPIPYKLPTKLIDYITKSHPDDNISSVYIDQNKDIINLFIPVYGSLKNVDSELKGIIVNTISLPDLINIALQKSKLKLSIRNTTDNTVLFKSNDITPGHSFLKQSIHIANQTWELTFFLNLSHLYSKTHWSIWWVLISGLLFTSLLGIGLLLLTGRYLQTEIIVNKRTEELLAAKNNAESANKAKNQFLSNISHELRTPLNGILGFSQLLQKKSYITVEDKKQINIINHCGNHLLTMINDILDISKIESNKIEIVENVFNFNDFIEDILSIFTLKADEKNLAFSVFKKPIPKLIKTDKKRLNQIISNLLSNAIKFTDSGYIKIIFDHNNEQLNINISDTGCGISETDQINIFTPFTQINSNNYSEEGIGLGLAICSELLQLMQGTISVESIIGQGSTFKVSLPLPYAKADNQSLAAAKSESRSYQTHILIAEDNEINIMLLGHLLKGLDCTFDTAENGEEALQLLCTQNYTLALIDLNMPVMDGFELIQAIRLKKINTPAIAVSAYADKIKIKKALSLGFNDYLTKPIDEIQLKNQIHKYT